MLSRTNVRLLKSEPVRHAPNRVRRAMQLAKVTQEQLEAQTSIPQATISKIVTGRMRRMPLKLAQRLSVHLGCSTDDLFPPDGVSA